MGVIIRVLVKVPHPLKIKMNSPLNIWNRPLVRNSSPEKKNLYFEITKFLLTTFHCHFKHFKYSIKELMDGS